VVVRREWAGIGRLSLLTDQQSVCHFGFAVYRKVTNSVGFIARFSSRFAIDKWEEYDGKHANDYSKN
jgi:hypothetical protein